ncbi:MAG: tetratricopeptide repeat protein [Polyangiaceae bacterium]|nr:tetratricopeptide repeat protein [Polyangiaceae bacterium]
MTREGDADALHRQGKERLEAGDRDGAEAAFRAALALDPDRTATLNNLGNLLAARGDAAGALSTFERAYALGSRTAVLLTNYARTALALDRVEDAARLAEEAVGAGPERDAGHVLLIRALGRKGDFEAACRAAEVACAGNAASGALLNEAGLIFDRVGRKRDAIRAFQQAVSLLPEEAAVARNLGDALRRAGEFDAAQAALERALALAPGSVDGLESLAALQITTGDCEEAAATAAHAATLAEPSRALELGSMRLFALTHVDSVAPDVLFEEHVRWGQLATRAASTSAEAAPEVARTKSGRKRVVYLSSDFRDHVVTRFLEPVIAAHDRTRFEIVLASTGSVVDAVTRALRERFAWADLAGRGREDARRVLRELLPDVIVELTGHSGDSVLPLLVPRIAPLQITYLGYPGTTGLGTIDLRITDEPCDPTWLDASYVERLARLERTPWAYVLQHVPPVREREAGPPTFGCFNRATKLSPTTLHMFARVLSAVPEARLVLRTRCNAASAVRRRILAAFEVFGAAERVVLQDDAPSFEEALAAYSSIDVALDTFPYHGTTTTCDALLMGVPVVSRLGAVPAARVAASILGAVGLRELAVDDADAFVATARDLIRDTTRLADLRATLRARVTAGAIGDPRSLAAELERTYAG